MIMQQIIALLYMKSETDTYSRQGADIKAESDKVTEHDIVIKETSHKHLMKSQWRSQQKNQQTSGVEKVTISGGTQAMTRASQERSAKDIDTQKWE